MAKPNAVEFIRWALPHALNKIDGTYPIPIDQVATDPWGYILGTSVVDCTEARIVALRKNYEEWSDAAYFAAARRWLGMKVTDCQGLADGFYRLVVGQNIDTTSRLAYANWCKTKGADMTKMPKQIGVALYMTGADGKDSSIHHVGFVCGFDAAGEPLVIEARGISHGVVITRFKGRGWNHWGLMDVYFDYDSIEESCELPCQMVVSTMNDPLNLRNVPSTGKVLAEMPKESRVWALRRVNDWLEVVWWDGDNYLQGWASGKYLR